MADVQPITRRGEKPVANVIRKPPPKGTDQKHPAGIFADMATDGPLIGTLVAVVDKAKNLPNLKSIGKQDPYCVLRLGKHVKKTEPDKRGGQTPKWDAELRFPVHDSADYRNLKIVIFTDDKKTELIGECILNLDNILDTAGGGQCDGWHQCKCRGRYAGDIRVELTFWDERPRESAPLMVNTRQMTGFEVADIMKRPEKGLAGPRRPGVAPKTRELPREPVPKPSREQLVPSSPEDEQPPEPPAAQHRKERGERREREPRERNREERRQRRDKSRHHGGERDRDSDRERERERRREKSRPPPDMYDSESYRRDQSQHHHNAPYDAHDQYGHYQNQVATLQDFQSEHIGKLQAQYVEQTQIVPHQRHSPNPAAYSGYQNDYYDQQPNPQQMGAMVLASQNGPPVIPQHRHVEFADTRRSMVPAPSQLPPQPPQGLHHRKSRSEFHPSNNDMYQTGNPYSNQLVSASSFAPPTLPRHHSYDQPMQQYQEQPLYAGQGFDQPGQMVLASQLPPTLPPKQQQPLQFQSNGAYQSPYQDPYAEQGYQSQLARASDFAPPPPPPPPQHNQMAAAYRTTPTPQDDYGNSSSLVLAHNSAAPPPLPSHKPRMNMQGNMPATIPASMPAAPIPQPLPPIQQQQAPTPQPMDAYEQSMQLAMRGFAPPPQLPAHGGAQFKPAPPPQPVRQAQQVQPLPPAQPQVPAQDPMQPRIRGNSEPPPYAAITDSGAPFNPEPQTGLMQQDQNGYNSQQNYPASKYPTPPAAAPVAYTSYTDYNKAAITRMPQNPEHAFDPTTALVLSGGAGGPPPLPGHSGTSSPLPAHRGRPTVPPISTTRKPMSRSPSPHPLALTPGYGPDSPGDEMLATSFAQPEPVSQPNYHAASNSMDSRPLMQQQSQQIDTNRRRSASPLPPMNSYTQELVSARGGPPPLPSASHRMSQHLVYKHDPSENPSENRSNRSSAYDFASQMQSSQVTNNHNNHHNGIPDSTYQSASTSWTAAQSFDDPSSRDPYMNRSSVSPRPHSSLYDVHSKQNPPSRNQSPYPNYGANDGMHMNENPGQSAPMIKPRATSPMPGRRNSDLPPMNRTPEPERQPSVRPEQRRMTLGGMPFSPDDYDVINPVGSGYNSGSRSPSGNVSTMPLARSPGAIAMSPGQYMTPKEEKKARKEEEKLAKKARKKVYTPNSANRELEEDDILAPETFAPEPARRNSFNANSENEDTQPLSFRPRRQTASPQPPGADVYGTSPGGRGYKSGPKSVASNTSSTPSSGYAYGAPPPQHHSGGGHRPLPGAPVMRNAIMGPEDYYQQQQGAYGASQPMRIPQPNPGNMSQEQWSLSQELSSISIGTSSRRRTGTWA